MDRRPPLTDRLVQLAVDLCSVTEQLPTSMLGQHVRAQLIRCGTAPFAHYSESQNAESARDYVHKIQLALKEMRESRAWLQFSNRALLIDREQTKPLDIECDELIAMLTACLKTARRDR